VARRLTSTSWSASSDRHAALAIMLPLAERRMPASAASSRLRSAAATLAFELVFCSVVEPVESDAWGSRRSWVRVTAARRQGQVRRADGCHTLSPRPDVKRCSAKGRDPGRRQAPHRRCKVRSGPVTSSPALLRLGGEAVPDVAEAREHEVILAAASKASGRRYGRCWYRCQATDDIRRHSH